jgi:hypothetical protein
MGSQALIVRWARHVCRITCDSRPVGPNAFQTFELQHYVDGVKNHYG